VTKEKIEWATTLKGLPKRNLDVAKWDDSLNKLEEMRNVLEELREVCFLCVLTYLLLVLFCIVIFYFVLNHISPLFRTQSYQPPFSRLSIVLAFVEREVPHVPKIEQQVVEKKFSKEVQGNIE
jgi:hypothetical protein